MNIDEAYQFCESQLRALDKDRWLACLFVAQDMRRHIIAIYAFSLEVARTRESVHEALTGEIRLQYWRDILTDDGQGETQANPVAAAVLDTVRKFNLPLQGLLNLIDARVFDLYDDPMPSLNDLEGYFGETSSVLFQMAALVLGADAAQVSEASGHAGVAYGLSGLMLALPLHISRGQCFIPTDILIKHNLDRDRLIAAPQDSVIRPVLDELSALAIGHLHQAQAAIAPLPAQVAAAFLPLSLIAANLKAVRANRNPARQVNVPPQWRKQWALWRASRALGSSRA